MTPYLRSPLLSEKLPTWRSRLIMAIFTLGFTALLGRAFWIQGPGNAFYESQGKRRFQRTLVLQAPRGRILDRNGLPLAASLPAKAVWGIPEDLPRDITTTQMLELANLLELPVDNVKRLLASDRNFVYLKRQVPTEVAEKIGNLNIAGIHSSPTWSRFYPNAEEVSHVVGFTNVEDVGQEGVELEFNRVLGGRAGRHVVIKNGLGSIIDGPGPMEPAIAGADVRLTVDSAIQHHAFQALQKGVIENKAKSGTAVVLDAVNGEILAAANWPAYDPNRRVGLLGEQLRNRAFTDAFEPGSTLKPVTISLALDKKMVTPNTLFDTAPGVLRVGPNKIHDTSNHGTINVSEIIATSSNIGTAKVAMLLAPQVMWENFIAMGFGVAPRVRFPGTTAGSLRPFQKWRQIEQITMGYGYGVSVSLIQLARAYTAFASDGSIAPITLVHESNSEARRKVMSPATAQAMRNMLELTVTDPHGTGRMAQIDGFRVGAKTGTARKQIGKTYAAGKYRAVFVGMAPMSRPRLIVAVMVDEPSAKGYSGGAVAGPIFKSIMTESLLTLGSAPDRSSD